MCFSGVGVVVEDDDLSVTAEGVAVGIRPLTPNKAMAEGLLFQGQGGHAHHKNASSGGGDILVKGRAGAVLDCVAIDSSEAVVVGIAPLTWEEESLSPQPRKKDLKIRATRVMGWSRHSSSITLTPFS